MPSWRTAVLPTVVLAAALSCAGAAPAAGAAVAGAAVAAGPATAEGPAVAARPAAVAGAAAAGPDLPALEGELLAATGRAQAGAVELDEARQRDLAVAAAAQDLEAARLRTRARLDQQVRAAYIAGAPRLLDGLLPGAGSAALNAAVRSGRGAADVAAGRAVAERRLAGAVHAHAVAVRVQTDAALAEQERARTLLTAARELAQTVAEQARLAEAQARLDRISAEVTLALSTPAVVARPVRGAGSGVLALLEAAGAGYPSGFSRSGQVLSGSASWYGPGFVGSPTASGTPYDPEQLTCAHKSLPLGTVLHVSTASRSTNCLVNDRGPYVGDRVLDLSRAGSRALGYDGVAEVVAEVLVRD